MNKSTVLDALGALAHEGRLDLLRLLIARGPDGTPVGELAQATGLKFGTASAQLAVLEKARLVQSERDGRIIRYEPVFETMLGLVTYLMQDCCGGTDSRIAACCELLACEQFNEGDPL